MKTILFIHVMDFYEEKNNNGGVDCPFSPTNAAAPSEAVSQIAIESLVKTTICHTKFYAGPA